MFDECLELKGDIPKREGKALPQNHLKANTAKLALKGVSGVSQPRKYAKKGKKVAPGFLKYDTFIASFYPLFTLFRNLRSLFRKF